MKSSTLFNLLVLAYAGYTGKWGYLFFYLATISSKSTGTAAAENTALTDDMSSGPTPSPGIIVTL